MTSGHAVAPDTERLLERWQAWLKTLSTPPSIERLVAGSEPTEREGGDGATELFVHEVFVRADPTERRSVDLLLVAHLVDRHDPEQSEMVVVGSEELHARARTDGAPGGVTFGEIPLRRPSAGRQVQIALLRIDRDTRSRDVAGSITALGRVLARSRDADGRTAVTRAVLRRLDVLTSGPGVEAPVWGTVGRLAESQRPDRMYLLTNAPLNLDDEVERRRNGLLISSPVVDPNRSATPPLPPPTTPVGPPAPAPASSPSSAPAAQGSMMSPPAPESSSPVTGPRPAARERRPWQDGDYVLVRVGRSSTAQGEAAATLYERRDSYLLSAGAVAAGSAPRDSATYSTRAAAARQEARARKVRDLAAGDPDAAARQLSVGLSEPGSRIALADAMARRVDKIADFWDLRRAAFSGLRLVEDGASGSDSRLAARETTDVLLDRLGTRLDELLRLDPAQVESPESYIPVVTPIVLELSDTLIPLVDNRIDGGHFLFTLVPAMRERVAASTGISVPGVRARGNPALQTDELLIQINELSSVRAKMPASGSFVAHAVDEQRTSAVDDVTDVHPVSGAPGCWLVTHQDDEPPTPESTPAAETDPDAPFAPTDYLAHRVERVIRAQIDRLFGVQEVASLLDTWRGEDAAGVARVVSDSLDEERLTVLLQRLAAERVPVTDWRAVLSAVDDAGGIATDLRVLHRAVRQRLKHALPGPRSGRLLITVPEPYQSALVDRLAIDQGEAGARAAHARVEFLGWLHNTIQEHGPVVSLLMPDDLSRETVAELVSAEHAVITTYTRAEVDDT